MKNETLLQNKNTLKEVDPLHYFVPYNKSPACAIVY